MRMRKKLIDSGQIVEEGTFKGKTFKFSEYDCYHSNGVVERNIREFGIKDGEIESGRVSVFKKDIEYPYRETLKSFSRVYIHGEFFTVE
jgi:hypothetical protein